MRALLQRVAEASVAAEGRVQGAIGPGLVVYLGCRRGDTEADAEALARRVARYRVFPDEAGRSNLDLRDVGGAVLLLPQFTLVADTRKGNRPSFTEALEPEAARRLVARFAAVLEAEGVPVAQGLFGAVMTVRQVGVGPASFLLERRSSRT